MNNEDKSTCNIQQCPLEGIEVERRKNTQKDIDRLIILSESNSESVKSLINFKFFVYGVCVLGVLFGTGNYVYTYVTTLSQEAQNTETTRRIQEIDDKHTQRMDDQQGLLIQYTESMLTTLAAVQQQSTRVEEHYTNLDKSVLELKNAVNRIENKPPPLPRLTFKEFDDDH